MRLENKVAIVTGSSSGISRAIAFASEGTAVTVDHVGDSRDAEEVVRRVEESGGRGLAGRTVEQFGRLDVMVTNAGMERKTPLLETPLEVWEVIAVNLIEVRGVT